MENGQGKQKAQNSSPKGLRRAVGEKQTIKVTGAKIIYFALVR